MEFYALDTDFWDVVAWMIIGFFFLIVITMFISVFSDIFSARRPLWFCEGRLGDFHLRAAVDWHSHLPLLPPGRYALR